MTVPALGDIYLNLNTGRGFEVIGINEKFTPAQIKLRLENELEVTYFLNDFDYLLARGGWEKYTP